MSPRRYEVDPSKGVIEVDWPLFGELSRALALRVAREYEPELVVGIATAGVIPGAVVAAILDRQFHSMLISRRFAPYVGVSWTRDVGRTADFTRANFEDPSDVSFVVGLRVWM